MAHFLITGSNGFVGRWLCQALKNNGHTTNGFDIKNDDKQNVVDYPALLNEAYNTKPDAIIHLAAISRPKIAAETPQQAYDITVLGTQNCIRMAENVPSIKKIVYFSSSMVYGDFNGHTVNESTACYPQTIYGRCKLTAEHLLLSSSMPHCIIRPSAIYGPQDTKMQVVGKFISQALKQEELLVSGGLTKLDFTYIDDVIRGTLFLIENDQNGIFNLTRGNARSLIELCEIIKTHVPDVGYTLVGADKDSEKRGTLDISKLKHLGWQPQVDLEQGVQRYIERIKYENTFY